VRTRAPRRQYAIAAALSLLYGGLLVVALGPRAELPRLPRGWLLAVAAAWTTSFAALLWLALVPRPREVMPRWRAAGLAALASAVLLPAVGLLWPRGVRGESVVLPRSASLFAQEGLRCLAWGLAVAAVPIAMSALFLRGAAPVRSRWVAAAVGAAGGSLGGLTLHLHCPIADRLHLGLVHGGLVLVGALVSAAAVPRFVRP
jgi:hypothetical protein